VKIDKQQQIEILKRGSIKLKGQFLFGSNYSFLVSLCHHGNQIEAIYKPLKGEKPLWDFPLESLADREVAAFIVSESLGWNLVPPTVIRRKADFGKGSLQVFIPHDAQQNYFTFNDYIRERLRAVALFDLIINNADRKGSHILIDESEKLWLIDHGLCFHLEPKLRTVIWDFAGQPIAEQLLKDISNFNQQLIVKEGVYNELKKHLRESEILATSQRIQSILDYPFYPFPDPQRRPFPWPLV